jgi:hypothetical protein
VAAAVAHSRERHRDYRAGSKNDGTVAQSDLRPAPALVWLLGVGDFVERHVVTSAGIVRKRQDRLLEGFVAAQVLEVLGIEIGPDTLGHIPYVRLVKIVVATRRHLGRA